MRPVEHDPQERRDLAALHPEVVGELARMFVAEAANDQVGRLYPLGHPHHWVPALLGAPAH